MAKPKYDILIEAVHYTPEGQIQWTRGYERRGPTFSDLTLIPRARLIELLKAGKTLVYGQRVAHLASTFKVEGQIRMLPKNGGEVLVTGDQPAEKDDLAGVPIL